MTKTPDPRGTRAPGPRAPRWPYALPLLALPAWIWALLALPEARHPAAVTAAAVGIALLVALAVLVDLRERRARALGAELALIREGSEAMAREYLPRMVERLREGASTESALHILPSYVDLDTPQGAVVRSVATEIAAAERRRAATMAACATAAGRMQALTTTMLADLRRMQEHHGDGVTGTDVLGDLMHLDHSTAQAGRIADSIAILTGARSGRRWSKAISLESILRGAMARIGSYQRIRTHNVPRQGIAGFAAEGVIHALAELLDNATKFSPPTAEVHVHVEEVQAGIAVMIEDGGLVMSEDALHRARAAVAGGLDIAGISGSRLGLSVVGQIAKRYDLSVSFRSSSRGGTAVVLLIPQKLVKPLPAQPAPAAAHSGRPTGAAHGAAPAGVTAPAMPIRPPVPAAPEAPPAPAGTGGGGGLGLPQRRRGKTLAAAQDSDPRTAAGDSRPATPVKGFGAFRSAVRGQDQTGSPKDA
ncbi:sensor histidine kinase [Nocardiopsis algeriensis]|uniref:ATP-binding protein n=1 Tax=Nocardiopsis algeriensis TaxID=1478215 RepID=UPI003B42BF74